MVFGFSGISLRGCLSWAKLEMGHGHKILTCVNTLKATKFEEVLVCLTVGSWKRKQLDRAQN